MIESHQPTPEAQTTENFTLLPPRLSVSERVKYLARGISILAPIVAIASESKHFGVPMPPIVSGYAIDLILPTSVATVLRFTPLPQRLLMSGEFRFLSGLAVCWSTELLQSVKLLPGTYDPVGDGLTFLIGAGGGYVLNRLSKWPNDTAKSI